MYILGKPKNCVDSAPERDRTAITFVLHLFPGKKVVISAMKESGTFGPSITLELSHVNH